MDNKLEKLVGKDFSKFLGKYDSPKYPPWMKRKAEGMFQAVAHPDFNRDIGILFYVEPQSVIDNLEFLATYFSIQYGVRGEISETWLFLAATGDKRMLDDAYQLSPTLLFDDTLKKAWPSNDPSGEYKLMQKMTRLSESSHPVNLRIGRSSTKEDVKWLLDKIWDTDIAPRLNKKDPEKAVRQKPEYLRNSTVYALHKSGKSVKEIAVIIDKRFPLSPDKKTGKIRIIDEVYIRKLIRDFAPEEDVDLFEKVAEIFDSTPVSDLNARKLKLKFQMKPYPHFTLV